MSSDNPTLNQSDNLQLDTLLKLHGSAVETQRHFNNICIRLRSLAMSLSIAYLAFSSAIVTKLSVASTLEKFNCLIIVCLMVALVLPLTLFWRAIMRLDLENYHLFLKASTDSVLSFENELKRQASYLSQIKLTSQSISGQSSGSTGEDQDPQPAQDGRSSPPVEGNQNPISVQGEHRPSSPESKNHFKPEPSTKDVPPPNNTQRSKKTTNSTRRIKQFYWFGFGAQLVLFGASLAALLLSQA